MGCGIPLQLGQLVRLDRFGTEAESLVKPARNRPAGVHLVGSIAMENCDEVFSRVSEELGDHVCRIPDGETGERSRWIFFQRRMLLDHPATEIDPTVPELELRQWDGKSLRAMPLIRFREGTDLDDVHFDTGYDKAAAYSYGVFSQKRNDGIIPDHTRFQVCLPTPMANGFMYASHKARDDFLRIYERSLLRALDAILAGVPNAELAIQFDVCIEVLLFENYYEHQPEDYKEQVFAMLSRLAGRVPDDVELGFHLCYGSPYDEPLVRPKNMAILVELANGIGAGVARRVDFMHLPVPQGRSEPAFYEPLRELKISTDTRIFLGLVFQGDPEGDQVRIVVARGFLADFGVATECGWGRTDPENVAGLLASHRQAAEALT